MLFDLRSFVLMVKENPFHYLAVLLNTLIYLATIGLSLSFFHDLVVGTGSVAGHLLGLAVFSAFAYIYGRELTQKVPNDLAN